MQYKYTKHKGFTLVEVMLLLVVLSLIFASSAAVITRKHKLRPRQALHGKYLCYRDYEDNLHEVMYAGKNKLLDKTYTPAEQEAGAECTFKGPTKTSYLYVQILGGGGAGGNANFYEEKKKTKKGQFISLFGDDAAECTNSSNNCSGIWDKVDGVSKEFIDSLFTNEAGETIFSGNIYRKLLNDYGVQMFSYDHAGGGSSGLGYEFYAAKEDAANPGEPEIMCGCLYWPSSSDYQTFSSAYSCAYRCFRAEKEEELPGFKNDTATCMMNSTKSQEENGETCPEAYTRRKLRKTTEKCNGGEGGAGSVFTSELVPFDFGIKAKLLPRNYDGTSSKISYSWSAQTTWDAIQNKNDKHYLTDRNGSTFKVDKVKYPDQEDNKLELILDPSALVAGTLQSCDVEGPDCIKYPDGKLYKIVEETDVNYFFYRDEYKTTIGHYTRVLATKPTYDFSKDKYIVPSFTKYTQELLDSDYKYLKSDGLYPYEALDSCNKTTLENCSYEDAVAAGNPYGVGLTTPSGTKYYRFKTNAILDGTDPRGKHGEGILGSEMVFKEKGIFQGCPSKAAGANGNTSFNNIFQNGNVNSHTNALICKGNMGVFLSKPDYRLRFHNSRTRFNSSSQKSYRCNDDGTPPIPLFVHDSLGLLVQYVQESISLSHGDHGRAGEVTSLFARSFGDGAIKLNPGRGGTHVEIDTDNSIDHKTARGNDGTESTISYNCNADETECDTLKASGGLGGKSRVWEDSRNNVLTGKQIYDLVNQTEGALEEFINKSSAYYSAPGPNNYKGEQSSFTETSKLLDLPNLHGINLADLGKGGDGGYVTYQCLIVPQYFEVAWNPLEDYPKDDDVWNETVPIPNYSKSELPGAETEWEGYTKFTQAEADAACAPYLSPENGGKFYKETGGTDGSPGAIVIMW